MTRKPRKPRPSRRRPATLLDAFSLAAAGTELALASLQVVNARAPMIAQACRDPARGNYAELSRMVSEKPLAFARGAAAGGPGLLAMAVESNRYLTDAWKIPAGAAPGLAAAAGLFQFWGRMATLGLAWQSAALAPVHAVAMANARRLAPKG
jgi:hypothetical protein